MEIDKLIIEGNRLLREAQWAHNFGNDAETYARLGELSDILEDEVGSGVRNKYESEEPVDP